MRRGASATFPAALLLAVLLLPASPRLSWGAGGTGAPAGSAAVVPVEAVPEDPVPPAPPGDGAQAGSPPGAPSPASPPPPLPAGAEGEVGKVRDLAREGRYDEASALLLPLLARNPGNGELLALRARLLLGEQRYEDSLPAFREALLAREDPELRKDMERARLAVVLGKADRLSAEGNEEGAEALLRAEYESGRERYETGSRLGRILMRRREFSLAAAHYGAMIGYFPDELDFRASRVEALLLSGDLAGGRREVDALSPADREALRVGREDLFYRMTANGARLLGEFVSVDRGRPDEDRFGAEGTFRLGTATAVAGASSVSRYAHRDSQLSLALRSPLGEGTDTFGTLSLSVSPDADFLPRWSAGAEAGQSLRRHDLSAGYRHVRFPSSNAGVATAAVSAWLPLPVVVGERVSVATSTGSWSSLTTLRYEPDHKLRIFASLSFGTLAERPESVGDMKSRFGYADRGGVEYRPAVEYSFGGELFHEHRRDEGDRVGGSLSARYYW